MLQLIFGRSGFGKTHRVLAELNELARHADADDVFYLIVPEQASFETERTLLRSLGDVNAAKIRVLSFTRLCETLMKSRTARPLSNAAKILMMNRAVEESRDSLSLLSASNRIDTATALLSMQQECRYSAVSTAQLYAAVDALPDSTLKTKTREVALVLEAYEALVATCGSDDEDHLARLCDYLNTSRVLQGATVYVDGFKSFTAPELLVLKAMMGQADKLTVTLCADRDAADPDHMDRLSVPMNTASRLKRDASAVGCPIASPVFLMKPFRFQTDALRVLEEYAFCPKDPDAVIPDDTDSVHLTACADMYAEARYVAQAIRRLMRQKNMRAREIAVVARSLPSYVGVLDAALEQAKIPYYLDRRAPIVSEGLVTAVLTALRIASGKWRTESLLQLVKTGLLGFSVQSASLMENYVFIWNLSGAQFKAEWQAHPRGFSAATEEQDVKRLAHLNRLRRRLVAPLMTLADALAKPLSGEEFAKAVYRYLHQAHIDRLVGRQIVHLRNHGEPALAEHTEQVWNALMALLDDMARVLPDRLSAEEATELLREAAIVTDIGAIPQAIDAVQIGAADRMRFTAPKAVFVLGANEGVFPALPGGQGLLSDRDLRTLIEAGVPFEDDREQHNATEEFLAYSVLSAASECVFVSYLLQLPAGDRGEPSSIVNTVKAHLDLEITPCFCDDGADIETSEEAFERMASGFRAGTPLSRALFEVLWQNEALRGRLSKMKLLAQELPITFEDENAAKRFFGDRLILSSSKADLYQNCRFAYFCRYGVKAYPLRAAEISFLEFGTLAHYVIENALPVYVQEGVRTVNKERCYADAAANVDRYVEQEMGGFEDKPERFLYQLTRLRRVCGNFLWQAVRELSQSAFTPADYELDIALHSEDPQAVKPLVFSLPDGSTVQMVGKIDRVDTCDINGIRYVRVIDYKTGTKVFRLADVVEGINLQMLIYMLTLWKNGGTRYGEVLPAGLLYMPAMAPMMTADSKPDNATLEKAHVRGMRMNGLLLDDPEVLRAMEPEVKGLFIPAKLNADGSLSATSAVAGLAEFGLLGKRVQTILEEMALTLRGGDIDAQPFAASGAISPACAYCPYKAVCGHEDGDRVRTPHFAGRKDLFDALREEEE
ncbi:MAG: hypothetical protein E7553_07010 [Ruminococcaceae bacterium]|nr:hypothetical protein [Oscillospiraceae bacterium]